MPLLEIIRKNSSHTKEILKNTILPIKNNLIFFVPCLIFFFISASFWQLGILSILAKGTSLTDSTILMGHFMLVAGLLIFPLGYLSDKFSKKIVVCLGFLSIILPLPILMSNISLKMELSFFLLGIGIGSLNAPIKILTMEMVKKYGQDKKYETEEVFFSIEICRRSMILLSSFLSWRLLSYSHNLPWFIWFLLSFIAIVTIIKFPKTPSIFTVKQTVFYTDTSQYKLYLLIIYIYSFFFGIEMGIRSVILNPYITQILNSGDLSSLQIQGLIQAIAGFFGTLIFNTIKRKYLLTNFAQNHPEIVFSLFIVLSMLIYSSLNIVSSFTTSFSIFLFMSGIAIISMGWFFPLRDALAVHYSGKKSKTITLAIMFSTQSIAACLTLYVIKYIGLEISDIRHYWKLGAISLLIASFILLIIPAISYSKALKSNINLHDIQS